MVVCARLQRSKKEVSESEEDSCSSSSLDEDEEEEEEEEEEGEGERAGPFLQHTVGDVCELEGKALQRQAHVEIKYDNKWWNATLSAVYGQQVLVHYTNGLLAEDEVIDWPFKRLRLPRHPLPVSSGGLGGVGKS
jgi:hypothetical protein